MQERAVLANIVVSAKCLRTFEDAKTEKGTYSAEFSVFNVLKVSSYLGRGRGDVGMWVDV